MTGLTKTTKWLNSRKWLILFPALLIVLYTWTDFVAFSEMIHASIKTTLVVVLGLALRSMIFVRTMGDYVDTGTLERDLFETTIEGNVRLRHYRWATTVCLAIPTALFFLA